MRSAFLVLLLLAADCSLTAQSVYLSRPDDANAVYLSSGSFGAAGNGRADDTTAVQAAIDRVQETTGEGIVFVAEGRYRISRTIHLWSGIRLIGYGAKRPVFLLSANTPGYQEGHEFLGTGRYMLQFASRRPAAGGAVVDANEFTFYSGINNIDFEIGEGNPAAIAIRFHFAQHSFLTHMNFRVGGGRAALEDVGNNASDLRIEGGEYGIISVRTSPAWQFLLMDSSLEGQRRAAIHTQEVGMTLVRDRIAHTPVAVQITEGMTEQLYGRDLTLENISQSGVVLGDARKAHHQVTLDHIVCRNVPQLIEGATAVAGAASLRVPSSHYIEEHLTIGLKIGSDGRERGIRFEHKEMFTASKISFATDIPILPPMQEWANVRMLGAKGDGGTDDTVALQAAIDRHRVLYFPSGTYRVVNTLRLRHDSILIGFQPVTTVITILDNEAAFVGEGSPVPVVLSARGGSAIVTGIGIATGDVNPRAAGLVWHAGRASMVDDVNFMRGHGRVNAVLSPKMPRSAGPTANNEGFADTQYPSLWVNDNGGGIFRGIWTASTIAKAGLRVENTTTPGVVYQMSCEHHLHNETQFHHASNWTIYALQTEEENPAGADSFSIELENAHDITFANLFMYRVSRNVMPKLSAIEATDSSAIRFENVHDFSQTRLAFDNSVLDHTSGVRVRTRDFTVFTLLSTGKPGVPLAFPVGVFDADAKLEQIANGFSNVSGLTVDDGGQLFLTDSALHKIYRWNTGTRRAEIVTDVINSPMAAGFVAPDSLLVLDYGRSIFRIDLKSNVVAKLEPTGSPVRDTSLLLPVGFHNSMSTFIRQMEHRGVIYAPRSNMAIVADVIDEHRDYFYAPGTETAVMAGGNWQPMLQASQWRIFHVGDEGLATSEEDDAVYHLRLASLNSITATEFIPRGGCSVVTDTEGNIYVAEGQLYVYDASGKQTGVVEIPERPSGLAFGGSDKRTLFIGARGSLFAIRTQAAGR